MKQLIISVFTLLVSLSLHAQQDINAVLASIEENNTTLQASRETMEAQKLANRTGIYLSNPEVEFGYLWGDPATIGKRTDFSVTQSFDLATLTGRKSSVANEQNVLAEWEYKMERMNILLEAKRYCIDLIYYNALLQELDLRLKHAETIAAGYEERLKRGDVSLLEYNKARLNLSSAQGEISRVEVERSSLLEQLKRLNGGEAISVESVEFEPLLLPPRFDDWYLSAEEQSPALAYIRQQVAIEKQQVALSKAMNLPTLTAGYLSEKVVGETYQGFTVGVSIPLWENKNQVKQARAAVKAAESRVEDGKQQFYSGLQLLYNRTAGLKTTAENYRQSLEMANSSELLKKALDAGEMSLLEYVLEMGLYYDTVNRALEAERDYQLAYAELSAVEL
ncbi:MAG: TolC family protein [Bacteroidales bacterium]|nr:TolC family protein [Bacteroidales bacterium]